MKQKLGLACTLIHEPPLLVLDEPTTGVDPVSRREFWKLLAEFLAQGLTILLATPYLDEAERCSRIALLNDGRVLALDQPASLQGGLQGTMFEVVATPARRAFDVLQVALGAGRVQLFGDRLHVQVGTSDPIEVQAPLEAAGIVGAEIRAIVPSLEDVFNDLVSNA
jgi:ABC-2 type transport system ATP-binding protein